MPSVNLSPINLTVTSTTRSADVRTQLTAGDSDAYPMTITFSDVEEISGTCQLVFERGDSKWTRDDSDGVTITDNAVSYMLESAFYAAAGLVCWVQFIDSNLHTTLRIGFPKIRIPGGLSEAETTQTYPTWVASAQSAESDRAAAEGLRASAETARAEAEDLRESAETAREGAEGLRESAETAREDAEGLRASAETAREDAEELRESAETARVAAEEARAVWEEWDSVTAWKAGNKVTHSGSSWVAVNDNTGSEPPSADWLMIASIGASGTIDTSTLTDLTGLIAGDGTNIRAATAEDGDALPVTGGTLGAQLSAIDADVDALFEYAEQSALVHYIIWDTALSQCTRGGVDAEITTTTTNFGHFGSVNANYLNPFDQLYPWRDRQLCNVDIPTYRSVYAAHGSLLDCVVAWEGDPDFELDGSNGFVGVYTPEFWGLVKLLKDGIKWFIGISSVPITGWTHYEETIGGRWFGVADGAGITSKPGIAVVDETMATIHARATAYDMTLDDIYTWSADTMLMAVEYATLNSQTAIGNGADAVYVQGIRPYIDESGVNRVVMTDAQSANFRTGVMIDIGTSDGGYQVARRIVTTIEDYGPDSAYAIINFDGAPVNIATTQYVSAHGTANVLDSDIMSTSGYIGTNSKCNAYYRGRVAHANYWRYCLGAYRQTGDGGIWIAGSRDAAAAADALNTGVHTDTGFVLPETSGYIASLHMLVSGLYPLTKTTGGSGGSANPVGDYTYVPSLATGNTVLRLGGYAAYGVYCGRFYGSWAYSSAYSLWSISGLPFLKTP